MKNMRITFEKNDKTTRLKDLKRRYDFNLINNTLFNRAWLAISQNKIVIYTVNGNTGKVKSIKIKK